MPKAIIFSDGCYGAWLHWVLYHLGDISEGLSAPINPVTGDCHVWGKDWGEGNYHLGTIGDPLMPLSDLGDNDLCRVHVGSGNGWTPNEVQANIEYAINNTDKSVLLHGSEESLCWILNNIADKIWDVISGGSFITYFTQDFINGNNKDKIADCGIVFPDHKKNLSAWPMDFDEDGALRRWIIREYLSLNAFSGPLAMIEMFGRKKLEKYGSPLIDMVELRDNFIATIRKVAGYLNLEVTCSDRDLNRVHQEWLATQQHAFKDAKINDIVSRTINGEDVSWSSLSLIDESLVQYFLRKRGYELKCDSLDIFPGNSRELKDLIYVA